MIIFVIPVVDLAVISTPENYPPYVIQDIGCVSLLLVSTICTCAYECQLLGMVVAVVLFVCLFVVFVVFSSCDS